LTDGPGDWLGAQVFCAASRRLRARRPRSMLVIGMFRRFSNSLFMRWRGQLTKPRHKTTTDFFTGLNAEHHRHAIRCLHAKNPSFKTASCIGRALE